MFAVRTSAVIGTIALFCAIQSAMAASNWQAIKAGESEMIAMDMASIAHSPSGTTAWSKVELMRNVSDTGGSYNVIRAQNLYDCAERRFTTLRRAFYNNNALIREDVVSRQRANSVAIGSIDERLLSLACQASAVDKHQEQTKNSPATATSQQSVHDSEHPSAMYADMRSLEKTQGTAILTPVADSASVAPVDKPKMIELPEIDKAAADKAAAEMASGMAARKAADTAAKASDSGANKYLTPPPAPAKHVDSAKIVESASDRRLRELHYATSGPPKRAKRQMPKKQLIQEIEPVLPTNWSYGGAGGPVNWGKLRPDYAVCDNGQRQSPIDIREGIKVNLEEIKFDYKPTQFRIIDNGHTVEVQVGQGMGLTVMNKHYELQQFHFHRPSEERVNGRAYEMVAHLVHQNDEGQFAVVSVLMEKGGEHPLIQALWNNMPLERGMEVTPADVIDLNKLLPENRAYWTYMGSLTTPPCTEGVLWMVLKQAAQVSPEQVAIFSHVYRNNARPVQASNARLIKGSR